MDNVQRMMEMFKSYTKYVIIVISMYLLGSFVAWDFNPGNWDQFGRYMIAMLSIMMCLINWAREDVKGIK
jgi:hypothetical protein